MDDAHPPGSHTDTDTGHQSDQAGQTETMTDSSSAPPEGPLSDLPTASGFELESLVDYQDGAIVSRTVLDREDITLTLFALDEGQTISEHSAPHDALVQVLDGTATITVDGTDHSVDAGEAIVLPADVPHALTAPTRFQMVLTMIR